jgi:hypothetical protein
MASQSISFKELRDITECPICTEVYTDPRVLPCIHTFCLKCIEGWGKDKQPGDKVACPLCRKEFEVPDGKLTALPKNFFVHKLLETKKISGASARKDTPCDVCSSDEATDVGVAAVKAAAMYCFDCQQNLCQQCCNCHTKLKSSSSHKTIELGSQLQSESILLDFPPSNCNKHPAKLVEI